ncbi:baseplate multidomain protein megatron [Maritalea sp.]|uniref:baseplate multidomain protein megatron n=1 Tax=Maritalea sp. TaxID=2003361 RepID=UPI003EF166F5
MATLLLAAGGQFIGGALGGPLGATIGRAVGALAGNVVDNQLFGQHSQPVSNDIRLLNSREGHPVSRLYGWSRVSGNIIWATELERLTKAGGGIKSIGGSEDEVIAANFAIGLCEGTVPHIGRIWADGELMDLRQVNHRFYTGTKDQLADSLIEGKQGAGNAPAYRNLAYLVFEQLDLTPYGNRIPQISVELCKPVGDLEERTQAICVIPGATEFGYDPTPRVRLLGNGEVLSENSHQTLGKSDWEVSITELTSLCPNLKHVALVVSWFGDDLRSGECTVTPRVMGHDRNIKDVEWGVAGLSRQQAKVCSQVNGGPAYGGTPSDQSVIAAINDLKARGIKVTIYPLMMMDIEAGNQLEDPYSGETGQANYPWRGRVTCNPAIGRTGTVDQTAGAAAQISNFVGTAMASHFSVSGNMPTYTGPDEWSYRRFILHCANLARAAGGVDAFLVGSEMVALSTVRANATSFPFVSALKSITHDARAILGAQTKITYAADWSEYHGYQPGDASGDKLFHLDELWGDSEINAIGIDNYMPLSDWRDVGENVDFIQQNIVHDLDYLKSNIAGGEGFDWYYASDADRNAQIRSPISDGDHNEDWVWKYKDLQGWWSNAHHNRVGGIRQGVATAWVPHSKPFWFTELGCGAVNNGANQPNAFTDPKSAENKSPYHSIGQTEPTMQRQFLRAHYDHWQPEQQKFVSANNPNSPLYDGKMLDPERTYLWAWDARPFPAFPLREDVWSDSPSFYTGHWTTGRFGCATASELAASIAQDIGVDLKVDDSAPSFVEGCLVSAPSAARQDVELLIKTDHLLLRDRPDGLSLTRQRDNIVHQLSENDYVMERDGRLERSHQDRAERVRRVNVSYADRLADYNSASLFRNSSEKDGAIANVTLPFTLDQGAAGRIADFQLDAASEDKKTIGLSVSTAWLSLEVGDVISIPSDPAKYVIMKIVDGIARQVTAQSIGQQPQVASAISRNRPAPAIVEASASLPITYFAQVPAINATDEFSSHLMVGSYAKPWPGIINIVDEHQLEIAQLTKPAALGILKSELSAARNLATWDMQSELEIELFSGHISSLDRARVLAGQNWLLVKNDLAQWEIIGFATASLIAPHRYKISDLLRGLGKTEYAAQTPASAGSPIMLIDGAARFTSTLETSSLAALAGPNDVNGEKIDCISSISPNLPLAPVHLRAQRDVTGNVTLSWKRRGRADGNIWLGSDIAQDVATSGFQVDIIGTSGVLRTIETGTPIFQYSTADQTADFGLLPEKFDFKVREISLALGPGHSNLGVFN